MGGIASRWGVVGSAGWLICCGLLLAVTSCGGEHSSESSEQLGESAAQLQDCSTLSSWAQGTYAAGSIVKSSGSVYQCKAFPFSGWCGQAGYQPGISAAWKDAWTLLDSCGGGTGGSGAGGGSGSVDVRSTLSAYCPNNAADCCPAGYTPAVLTEGPDTYQTPVPKMCVVGRAGSDTIAANTANHVVLAGAGDDTFQAANGDNHVVPGPGVDNVATGVGNDTIYVFDVCEVSAGDKIDAGTGDDTLITPVPLSQLQALGYMVTNVEHVVVQSNTCRSECGAKPDCSGHGSCAEGASAGEVVCKCDPGHFGAKCETSVVDPDRPTGLTAFARSLDLPDRGPVVPLVTLPTPSDGGTPVNPLPPIVSSFPLGAFGFKVTHARLGYDDDSPGLRARIELNGAFAGDYSYGCFSPCIGGGCIVPPIGTYVDTADQVFSAPVNLAAPVTVTIEYFDYDACGPNDAEGSTTLTFDPMTGALTGGTPDLPNCDASGSGWGICWEAVPAAALPPAAVDVTTIPQVCATWRADFVDEGNGEAIVGVDAVEAFGGGDDPPTTALEYPASFAKASLAMSSASGATVWHGNLDAEGCIPAGALAARGITGRFFVAPESAATGGSNPLWLRLDVTTELKKGDVTWQVLSVAPGTRSFDNPPVFDFAKKVKSLRTYSAARVQASGGLATFGNVEGWRVPPPRLIFNDGTLDDLTRVSTVIGRLLVTHDNGTVPGTYVALGDDGCNSPSLATDSCFSPSDDALYVGPATAGLPSQSHWKYITAHEAGHYISERAFGGGIGNAEYTFQCPGPNGTMVTQDDPCDAPPVCGCSHVTSANSLHCLQSVERAGDAQGEGFAQFYASKVWNDPNSASCGFAYYKEFLWPNGQCPAGATCAPFGAVGGVQTPPVAVSCMAPRRWRNSNCITPGLDAKHGTEFDWMGFLYNLDKTSPSPTVAPVGLSTGIFAIYQKVCGGPCDRTDNVAFSRFLGSTVELYGQNDPRSALVAALGNAHGVSEDLTP
jgi:hypothetical protein